ncbi:helix-turn-helix domain-containing protein [Candidatus Aenigmatarchaeota archaeon]
MITRSSLISQTTKTLDKAGFDYFEYDGCFDIFARKDNMFFLKILLNVDSFQEEQSENLKTLSRNTEAKTVVVGHRTRYENLDDDIIYERFGVPTVTPHTLERILFNDIPLFYRGRGGLFAVINPEKLREARKNANISQSILADKVGVSKKCIYEHEANKKPALLDIVEKIEKVLDTDIKDMLELPDFAGDFITSPKNEFEKIIGQTLNEIGFETDFVDKTPFNVIAKEKVVITTNAENNKKTIEKNIPFIKNFTDLFNKHALIITDSAEEYPIPSLTRDEISDMTSHQVVRKARKR